MRANTKQAVIFSLSSDMLSDALLQTMYSQIVYLSYLPNTSYRWLRHANILEKMFLSYELTSIVNYLGSQPNYHQSVFLFMHLSSMKIFARNLIFPLQTMLLITSIILSNCVNVQVWLIFLASVNLSGDAASRRILAWTSH
jgi:hypothetical protein